MGKKKKQAAITIYILLTIFIFTGLGICGETKVDSPPPGSIQYICHNLSQETDNFEAIAGELHQLSQYLNSDVVIALLDMAGLSDEANELTRKQKVAQKAYKRSLKSCLKCSKRFKESFAEFGEKGLTDIQIIGRMDAFNQDIVSYRARLEKDMVAFRAAMANLGIKEENLNFAHGHNVEIIMKSVLKEGQDPDDFLNMSENPQLQRASHIMRENLR